MSDVLRIIDANANRAREALRVMEEAARFLLNDRDLTELLKGIRHDLTTGLLRLDGLEFHRRVAGDVGTSISTPAERSRTHVRDVVIAAGKRLGEALRSIEEYSKTIDGMTCGYFEQLRYRGYEAEQVLLTRLGSPRRGQWRVCVLLTEALCRDGDWQRVARAVLDAGVDAIQLREKELSDRELVSRARWLMELSAGRAAVIVNDRADVALAANADGVHLGQDDMSVGDVRKLAGRGLIVGVSTSNMAEARAAYEAGADYCGVGPMFPTMTKKKDVIAGPEYLREYLEWAKLPHLAIGGIDVENIDKLLAVGCRGVAVSSAVCAADDAGVVLGELLATIRDGSHDRQFRSPPPKAQRAGDG